MDMLWEKGTRGQDADDPVEETLERPGRYGADVLADGLGAHRAANGNLVPLVLRLAEGLGLTGFCRFCRAYCFGPLCAVLGLTRSSPAGPLSNLPAVEPHEAHERLGPEDDGLDMPEERQPAHDAHQVDEQDRVEADIAAALLLVGVQLREKLGDAELIEEAEELVEEIGIAEAVNLLQILAICDALCDTGLVLSSGEPDEPLGGTLRGVGGQVLML